MNAAGLPGEKPPPPVRPPEAGSDAGPPAVDSAALLGPGRELIIRHGKERYRLLLTAQNKLILTK